MSLKLCLIQNCGECWTIQHDFLMQFVSKERQQRISRYRYDSDKILSLVSACITRVEISKLLQCPKETLSFLTEKNHKPKLNPQCHPFASKIDFNFSHTKNAVLFGLSDADFIGVDIELIQKPPLDIMDIAFHPEEKDFINKSAEELKSENFYKIWTKKEAYTKCTGSGLITNLCEINTLDDSFKSFLYSWKKGNYICSVCIMSRD